MRVSVCAAHILTKWRLHRFHKFAAIGAEYYYNMFQEVNRLVFICVDQRLHINQQKKRGVIEDALGGHAKGSQAIVPLAVWQVTTSNWNQNTVHLNILQSRQEDVIIHGFIVPGCNIIASFMKNDAHRVTKQ